MNARVGLLMIAGLAVVLGAFGCEEDTDVAREPESPAAAEDVRRETGEAIGAVAEYVGEKRDQFLADSQQELQKLEQRFAEMKDKAVAATGESSEKLENLRVEVSEKLARAKEELADLRQAGSDAWAKAAGEFSSAMQDLQEAYREFVQAYEARRKESDVARG